MDTFKVMLWRLVRGAVATAAAQTVVLQVDWSNPEVAVKALMMSFVSGFLLAASKGIRSATDNTLIQRLPV